MLPSPCGLRLGLWAWASTPRHASRQSVHALDPTRRAPRHINTPATSNLPAETLHTFEGMSDTYRELASLKLSPADLQVGAGPRAAELGDARAGRVAPSWMVRHAQMGAEPLLCRVTGWRRRLWEDFLVPL